MRDFEFERFSVLMEMLGRGFGEEPDEEKIELFWEFLRDIHIDLLKEGVRYLLRNRVPKGFPTIAEIREAVKAAIVKLVLGGDQDNTWRILPTKGGDFGLN